MYGIGIQCFKAYGCPCNIYNGINCSHLMKMNLTGSNSVYQSFSLRNLSEYLNAEVFYIVLKAGTGNYAFNIRQMPVRVFMECLFYSHFCAHNAMSLIFLRQEFPAWQ